jgi:hypothetical protein
VITQQPVAPDSVRATLDRVFAAPAYAWRPRRDPFAFIREFLADVRELLAGLAAHHPVTFRVVLFALVAVLVVILVHFGYLVWQSLRTREREPGAERPGLAVRDDAWHLAEVRRLVGEGRYAEAIAHRFAALVFALHRRAALRLDTSKTPAEYATEARLDAAGRRTMGVLVDDLYLRLFGGATSGADDVHRFDELAVEVMGHVATS